MFVEVNEKNILHAANVHSLSWKDSHKGICKEDFIDLHSVDHQKKYLKSVIDAGGRIYMLIHYKPVGIVSVNDNMIENLYVIPDDQHRGYETELLKFALDKCSGIPTLWILNTNIKAFNLYSKYGFKKTGVVHMLSEKITEQEMQKRD